MNKRTSKNIDFLNKSSNYKFVTRNWNIVGNQSNANFSARKKIIKILKSSPCDYNDAYKLVRVNIKNKGQSLVTEVAFKNRAPFISCIT